MRSVRVRALLSPSSLSPSVGRARCVSLVGLAVSLMAGVWAFPGLALALPEGRHYEMVSPPYKGGYGVFDPGEGAIFVAPDGDGLAFRSLGAFAGAPAQHLEDVYFARRDPVKGWGSVPLVVPAAWPYSPAGVQDFSSTLETALFEGKSGANSGEAAFDSTETDMLLHGVGAPDTPESFEVAGKPLTTSLGIAINYVGSSPDLSHIIFEPEPSMPLTPEAAAVTALTSQYELVTRGVDAGTLRLLGVDNRSEPIAPSCNVEVKTPIGKGSGLGAIADGGEEVFFTTCAGSPSSKQVFVRLGGERTLEVSRPFEAGAPFGGCVGEAGGHVPGEVPCVGAASRASAEFVSASDDGSRVLFTTSAALSEDDKDTGDDLYLASIGCPSGESECGAGGREVTGLTHVSRAVGVGEAAEVQGVVAVNPDASHVYFVARGVLSEGPNAEGQMPVHGADNLYLYEQDAEHPGGVVVFVTDLCSGPSRSGVVGDGRCPLDLQASVPWNDDRLWAFDAPEAQTTGSGRFLVFASYGRLALGDTDNAKDVYRYDAQTGALVRVSGGENGYGANGNCDEGVEETRCDATIRQRALGAGVTEREELSSRAVSEDGSRVVFTSAAGLSPLDKNGLVNAYEWHDGSVGLVSVGDDPEGVSDVVIDPSGENVFFVTARGLVPQDTDGVLDVYDARLGAGFPAGGVGVEGCEGEGCQGALSNPAPLLVPGSVSQAPGENVAPAVVVGSGVKAKPKPKRKAKPKSKKKGKRRRARRAGSVVSGGRRGGGSVIAGGGVRR